MNIKMIVEQLLVLLALPSDYYLELLLEWTNFLGLTPEQIRGFYHTSARMKLFRNVRMAEILAKDELLARISAGYLAKLVSRRDVLRLSQISRDMTARDWVEILPDLSAIGKAGSPEPPSPVPESWQHYNPEENTPFAPELDMEKLTQAQLYYGFPTTGDLNGFFSHYMVLVDDIPVLTMGGSAYYSIDGIRHRLDIEDDVKTTCLLNYWKDENILKLMSNLDRLPEWRQKELAESMFEAFVRNGRVETFEKIIGSLKNSEKSGSSRFLNLLERVPAIPGTILPFVEVLVKDNSYSILDGPSQFMEALVTAGDIDSLQFILTKAEGELSRKRMNALRELATQLDFQDIVKSLGSWP